MDETQKTNGVTGQLPDDIQPWIAKRRGGAWSPRGIAEGARSARACHASIIRGRTFGSGSRRSTARRRRSTACA